MRIFRRLIIVLVVLGLLLVGIDVLARDRAESAIGEQIATRSRTSPAPDVSIHGFSFLWQVLREDVDLITVTRKNLTLGKLGGVDLVVQVHDLTMPMSTVFGGDVSALKSARTNVQLRIDPAALADVIGLQKLSVSPVDGGGVRLSSTVAAAGRTFPIEADVTLRVAGGTLSLAASRVNAGGVSLPPSVSSAVLKSINIRLPLNGLPFSLPATSATVDGDRIVLTGTAENVPIGRLIAATG